MITYFSNATASESHPCQVSWLNSDSKPLAVKDVTATLFLYNGVVRTIISGPVLMQQTDQTHRYVTKLEIPSDSSGKTLFVEYKALLVADDSEVFAEQTISVRPLAQTLPSNNIISVI
jgi:hypothetical protein